MGAGAVVESAMERIEIRWTGAGGELRIAYVENLHTQEAASIVYDSLCELMFDLLNGYGPPPDQDLNPKGRA